MFKLLVGFSIFLSFNTYSWDVPEPVLSKSLNVINEAVVRKSRVFKKDISKLISAMFQVHYHAQKNNIEKNLLKPEYINFLGDILKKTKSAQIRLSFNEAVRLSKILVKQELALLTIEQLYKK